MMRHHLRPFAAVCAVLIAHGLAAQQPTAAATVDPNLQRAQAAMAELGQSLRSALQEKIAADGIVAAVAFCHDEAPRIAAAVTQKHGVVVGRTSVKHRSPANAPTSWQQAMLGGFGERVAQGEDAAAVTARTTADGTLRVAKGIKVEAACLSCHGPHDKIAPEVATAIAASYPADAATGFREGDLRGMIWAEVALDGDAAGNTLSKADAHSPKETP